MSNKARSFYNHLVSKDITVPDTYEEFESAMQDSDVSSDLYSFVKMKGITVPDSVEEFSSVFSVEESPEVKKKEPTDPPVVEETEEVTVSESPIQDGDSVSIEPKRSPEGIVRTTEVILEGKEDPSTVLMSSHGDYIPPDADGKYVAFPRLFPKDPDNQTSDSKDWIVAENDDQAYELAKERGEVLYFDTREEADAVAEGSWKEPKSDPETVDTDPPIDPLKQAISFATYRFEQRQNKNTDRFDYYTEVSEDGKTQYFKKENPVYLEEKAKKEESQKEANIAFAEKIGVDPELIIGHPKSQRDKNQKEIGFEVADKDLLSLLDDPEELGLAEEPGYDPPTEIKSPVFVDDDVAGIVDRLDGKGNQTLTKEEYAEEKKKFESIDKAKSLIKDDIDRMENITDSVFASDENYSRILSRTNILGNEVDVSSPFKGIPLAQGTIEDEEKMFNDIWNSDLLDKESLNMSESAAEEAFSRIYQKKIERADDLARQEAAQNARNLMIASGVPQNEADQALVKEYAKSDVKTFSDKEKQLYDARNNTANAISNVKNIAKDASEELKGVVFKALEEAQQYEDALRKDYNFEYITDPETGERLDVSFSDDVRRSMNVIEAILDGEKNADQRLKEYYIDYSARYNELSDPKKNTTTITIKTPKSAYANPYAKAALQTLTKSGYTPVSLEDREPVFGTKVVDGKFVPGDKIDPVDVVFENVPLSFISKNSFLYDAADDNAKRAVDRWGVEHAKSLSDKEAAARLHLLNLNPSDLEVSKLQEFGKGFVAGFVGEESARKVMGATERQKIDEMINVLMEQGEPVTDEQLDKLERTFTEGLASGAGDFTAIGLKLLALNKVAGVTRIGELLRTVTSALNKGTKAQKALAFTLGAAYEETQMQTAGMDPLVGATFFAAGKGLTAIGLSNIFKLSGRAARLNIPANKLFESGVKGTLAAESSHLMIKSGESLLDVAGFRDGGKTFKNFMKETYGDLDVVNERLLTNAILFPMFAAKDILRPTNFSRRMQVKEAEKLREAGYHDEAAMYEANVNLGYKRTETQSKLIESQIKDIKNELSDLRSDPEMSSSFNKDRKSELENQLKFLTENLESLSSEGTASGVILTRPDGGKEFMSYSEFMKVAKESGGVLEVLESVNKEGGSIEPVINSKTASDKDAVEFADAVTEASKKEIKEEPKEEIKEEPKTDEQKIDAARKVVEGKEGELTLEELAEVGEILGEDLFSKLKISEKPTAEQIVETLKQEKDAIQKQEPKEDAPVDIASEELLRDVDESPEKYGYHGGTLGGKSDMLTMGYMGEQPFTGHYFYGDRGRAELRGDRSKTDNKEARAVDFSKYNLIKPTTEGYWVLKSGVKKIWNNLLKGREIDSEIERIESFIPEVGKKLRENKENIDGWLDEWQAMKDKNFATRDYAKSKTERFETFLLKKLGYEGVDVRGLKEKGGDGSPDKGAEGSVIFDLKEGTVVDITPKPKKAEPKSKAKEAEVKEEVDPVIKFLDKAIKETSTKGKAFDATIGLPLTVLNGSLKVVKKAYETTKDIAKAVEAGIKYLKSKGQKFDESEYKKYVRTSIVDSEGFLLVGEAGSTRPDVINRRRKEFDALGKTEKGYVREYIKELSDGKATKTALKEAREKLDATLEGNKDLSKEAKSAVKKYAEAISKNPKSPTLDVVKKGEEVGKKQEKIESLKETIKTLKEGSKEQRAAAKEKLAEQKEILVGKIKKQKEGIKDAKKTAKVVEDIILKELKELDITDITTGEVRRILSSVKNLKGEAGDVVIGKAIDKVVKMAFGRTEKTIKSDLVKINKKIKSGDFGTFSQEVISLLTLDLTDIPKELVSEYADVIKNLAESGKYKRVSESESINQLYRFLSKYSSDIRSGAEKTKSYAEDLIDIQSQIEVEIATAKSELDAIKNSKKKLRGEDADKKREEQIKAKEKKVRDLEKSVDVDTYIEQLIDSGRLINEADANWIRNNYDRIKKARKEIQKEAKDPKTRQELIEAAEKKMEDAVDRFEDVVYNQDSNLSPESFKRLAERDELQSTIAQALNTIKPSDVIKYLSVSQARNLSKVIENAEAGLLNRESLDIAMTVEGAKSVERTMALGKDFSKRVMESGNEVTSATAGFLEKDLSDADLNKDFREKAQNVILTNIDSVVKGLKKSPIWTEYISPYVSKKEAISSKNTKVQAEAKKLLTKMKGNALFNDTLLSVYLRAREFDRKLEDDSTILNPIDYIDATLSGRPYMMSSKRAALKDLKEVYKEGGFEALEDMVRDKGGMSFVKYHDKVYSEIEPSSKSSAQIIQQQPYSKVDGYSSRVVDSSKSDISIDKRSLINPGYKAGSLMTRTSSASPLRFTALNDLIKTHRDQLTTALLGPEIIRINKAVSYAKKVGDMNTLQLYEGLRDVILKDIESTNQFQSIQNSSIGRYYLKAAENIKTSTLSGAAKVGAEVLSGWWKAMVNTKSAPAFAKGLDVILLNGGKTQGGRIEVAYDILSTLNSTHQNRTKAILDDRFNVVQNLSDQQLQRELTRWENFEKNAFGNLYAQNFKKVMRQAASYPLKLGDSLVVGPLTVGGIYREFKKITGEEFNFERYKTDPVYRAENRNAVRRAVAIADKTTTRVSGIGTPGVKPISQRKISATADFQNFFRSFSQNEAENFFDAYNTLAFKPQGTFEDRGDAASFMFAQLTSQAFYFTLRQYLITGAVNTMAENISGITDDEKRKIDTSFSQGIGGRVVADLFITNLLGKYGTAEKLLAATAVNAGMIGSGISEKEGPAFGLDIARQVYLPTLASKAGPGGLAVAGLLGASFKMYEGWMKNPEASGFSRASEAVSSLGYSEGLALAKIIQPIPFGQELSSGSYLRDKAFRDRVRINSVLGKKFLNTTLDRTAREIRDIEDFVGAELKPVSLEKTWTAPNKAKYKLTEEGVAKLRKSALEIKGEKDVETLLSFKAKQYYKGLEELTKTPEYITQDEQGRWSLIKKLKTEVDKNKAFKTVRDKAWINLLKIGKDSPGKYFTKEE